MLLPSTLNDSLSLFGIPFKEVKDIPSSPRKDSPLKKADDAIEIDNSNLSEEEQFAKILNLVKNNLENEK